MTEITVKAKRSAPIPVAAGNIFTVMDAECSLCAKGAGWIARNDGPCEFRIIPAQSGPGRGLLEHYGLDPDDPASWLYVEDGKAFASLDALIQVGLRLGGVWKALIILRLIPRSIRDWLYRLVARNRYRLFGRAELCVLPDPEIRKRLVT